MESAQAPLGFLELYLGDYEIVEVTPTVITIALGKGVHIHISTGGAVHNMVRGGKLPLYTRVIRGQTQQPPIQ